MKLPPFTARGVFSQLAASLGLSSPLDETGDGHKASLGWTRQM